MHMQMPSRWVLRLCSRKHVYAATLLQVPSTAQHSTAHRCQQRR